VQREAEFAKSFLASFTLGKDLKNKKVQKNYIFPQKSLQYVHNLTKLSISILK